MHWSWRTFMGSRFFVFFISGCMASRIWCPAGWPATQSSSPSSSAGSLIAVSVRRHTNANRFRTAAFFRARALRIYPPLIFSVLLSLLIYAVMLGLGIHGIETFRLGGELFLSREKIELEWDRCYPRFF